MPVGYPDAIMIQVLMVCLGNICRSPMAQAVTFHHALRSPQRYPGEPPWVRLASAGTHPGLLGSPCDPRARAALQRRGYEALPDRARRITDEDFERFDLILAMDQDNLTDLQRRGGETHRHKIKLFLDFAPETGKREIPDPYYGDAKGFERVLDLCEAGAAGLIRSLRESGGLTQDR